MICYKNIVNIALFKFNKLDESLALYINIFLVTNFRGETIIGYKKKIINNKPKLKLLTIYTKIYCKIDVKMR